MTVGEKKWLTAIDLGAGTTAGAIEVFLWAGMISICFTSMINVLPLGTVLNCGMTTSI